MDEGVFGYINEAVGDSVEDYLADEAHVWEQGAREALRMGLIDEAGGAKLEKVIHLMRELAGLLES